MNNNNIKLNSPKLSLPTTSAKGRDEEGAPFTTTGPPLGFMQDHVFVVPSGTFWASGDVVRRFRRSPGCCRRVVFAARLQSRSAGCLAHHAISCCQNAGPALAAGLGAACSDCPEQLMRHARRSLIP